MKGKFTKIMAALALLVFMTPSLVAWGQTTYSLTPNNTQTGLTNTSYITTLTEFTYNSVSWKMNQWNPSTLQVKTNQSSPASEFRFYNTSEFPGRITQVIMTFSALTVIDASKLMFLGGTSEVSVTTGGTAGTWNSDAKTLTWTPGESDDFTYFAFYQNGKAASGTNYLASTNAIVVTYETGSTQICATPTFTPDAGTYTETLSVTISSTEGATIYYSTVSENGPWTEYESAITVDETMTLWAYAEKEGYDNSAVATATYTFPDLITIAEARALDNEEYALVKGIVTFVDGKNVFIQDETAGIVLFLNANASGVALGDEVKAYGKKTTYNGLIELTGINQNSSVFNIISSGNELPLATKTIAEILDGAANTLQCTRVKIEDAVIGTINTNGNTPLTQDNSSINIYKVPSLSEIQSGDHVNVIGVIGYFNAAQLRVANADDVEKIVNTDPSINIANATISVSAEGASGTLAVTYTNITEINAEVIFCDANGNAATYDWITANINSDNNVAYTINANDGEARTAYLKVKVGDTYSNLVTINQEEYVAPTVATLPFTYDGNGQGTLPDGFTVNGLSTYNSSPKMQFNSTGDWAILHFGERPGTLTFDIKGNSFSGGTFKVQTSEDGETYTDLKTYTELGNTQSESFNNLGENVRYIKWIYTQKVSGNVALGNIALAKYVIVPSITVTPATLNVEAGQYVVNDELILAYDNIDVVNYESFTIQFYDAEGEEQEMPEWLVLGITGTNDEGYQVNGYISPNESDARSTYFKVYVGDTYSNLVTINQAAYVAPFEPATYTLATSIESGKTYIIVNQESSKAMGAQNDNNRAAADVTIQDQTITVTSDAVYEFVIESVSEGKYCIYDDRTGGFLYAASSNSNLLKTKAGLDDNGKWTITFNQDGDASIVAQGDHTRNVMQYNSGSTLFSCYGSASQKPVYLYEKEEETPEPETYELTINGYTDAESKAGYYLIASPVTVNIADVDGLTEGDFDLYSYDESQELEWINYKQEDGSHPFTTLEPGKGYLYAKKATAETSTYTFTLTGTPYYGTPIVLSKQSTGTLAGWNLIGNPLATSNIAPGRAFYIMNSTIGELIASESNTVEPMQGFFVIADEDGEEFELTVPLGGDGNLDKLVMNLSQNRGTVIDRAIVRFGEGEQLPKFQLFESSTKLYIPQGNSDYAIVRSAAEGEMPVNFKAKENGTYTISVNTENVEMDYLHLIDNMTGNDVDLLATPSYTFEATTRDYASRFRLVFSANVTDGPSTGSGAFAYFNGSEWQISNIGEATLQVVDVMGRIVKSVALEGNATVSINEMPGVYMMRLLNGNDVKVQKVVIR
jgi:hypothetical protein